MESMKFFIFYITCFLLVLIIVSGIRSGQSLERLIEVLMIGTSLTGLYAIYQRIKGIPMDPSLTDWVLNEGMSGRAYSTMGNPNNYAELLILILPFFIAMVLNAKSIYRKVFYFTLSFPPLIALFLTGARSSWIALVIAVLVFVFLKDWKLIPFVAILGILAFLFLPYISPSVYKRVLTIFTGTDTSINYRGAIYQTVVPMLKDFWFTGLGLGAGAEQAPFMKILQRYSLFYLRQTNTAGYATTPPHTHNLFLQIWIEVGFVGILTYIWFIARTVKRTLVNIYRDASNSMNHISMAGISALAGILVMGMAEYVWFYPRLMLFFWVIVGIVLSALNILDKRELQKN
jgi:O-antigen ligase